eukprot:gene23458-26555_t
MEETLQKIDGFIQSGKPHQHVVVNVDKLVKAAHDAELRRIINECALINVDGMPVVWASRLLGKPLKERVAGVDLRHARAQARRRIGYVSQKFALYGNLSVRENLEFFGGAYGLRGGRLRERMDAVLRHGADPLARREFWRRITALAEAGTTVVITTHFMEEAEYCDRIVIQDAGRLLAIGTPREVRAQALGDTYGEHDARRIDMEQAFIGIVEKEFRQLLRDRSNLAIGILLPMVLILIFGYGMSLDVKHAPVAIVFEDASPGAHEAMAGLQLSPTLAPIPLASMHDAERLMRERRIDAIVRVPSDFSRALAAGQARVQVIVHGAD